MANSFFILSFYLCIGFVAGVELSEGAKRYLRTYGYIYFNRKYEPGLKKLQVMASLKPTGILDKETENVMKLPRCDLSEVVFEKPFTHGSKWKKNLLTWNLVNTYRREDKRKILEILRLAFKTWSGHGNLRFKESSSPSADIIVKFAKGFHKDPYPFASSQKVAHGFAPFNNKFIAGDIHLNENVNFTLDVSSKGISLLSVIVHEIGHSIGLVHSNVRDSVMNPWFTTSKLHQDDIGYVKQIYGQNEKLTSTTSTTTTPTTTTMATTTARPTRPIPKNIGCPIAQIATVYYNTYARMPVLLTQNDKMYFLNRNSGIRYGPTRLKNYIIRIRNITAAYNTKQLNSKNYTVFFSGENYYIYQHFRYRSGPHSIHGDKKDDQNPLNLKFPSSVKKIDAAIVWYRNKRTYFFSGTQYWRYDSNNKAFDTGYPKNISTEWRGLPQQIDAAFSSDRDRKTFFIHKNRFYLLHDRFVRVKESYPEHIGRQWLDCGGRSSMKLLQPLSDQSSSNQQRRSDKLNP